MKTKSVQREKIWIILVSAIFYCMIHLPLPVLAEDIEISDFSELQNAVQNYISGSTLVFTNNITDATSTLSTPESVGLKIDAQTYTYTPNAIGFKAFLQSGVGSGRPTTLINFGTNANPITGWYESGSTQGSFIRSGKALTVANSYFSENGFSGSDVTKDAGVIYSHSGNVVHILDSTFIGNKAQQHGGVLYTKSGEGYITVNNSIFQNNTVSNSTNNTSYGGALRIEVSNTYLIPRVYLYVKDSEFKSNTSEVTSGTGNAFGGAISTVSAIEMIIQNCLFDGNAVGTVASGSRAQGGAITVGNFGTIINSSFTNNSATAVGNNALGGAISYNGAGLNIIADGADCIFLNNQANSTLNDIYIYDNDAGPVSLNASEGNKIEFNGSIDSDKTVHTIEINKPGSYSQLIATTDNTYGDIPNNSLSTVTVPLPTDGKIVFNNLVRNANINLYGGILELNQTRTSADISTCNLNLSGGLLDISNGQLQTINVDDFASVTAAKIDFDANMRTGISDQMNITGNLGSNSAITINTINITEDGDYATITLFTNGKSPILNSIRAYTNQYEYEFTPSNTINGVLNVTQTLISQNALKAAVDDPTLIRNFSMTENETVTVDLGAMAGGNGAELTILGNTFEIDGNDNNGIIVNSNQILNIRNVSEYYDFSSTTGAVVQNIGTLTASVASFNSNTASGNGGVFANSGIATLAQTSYISNTAANGGAIYNSGTMNIDGAATFTGNIVTNQGGAIYNSGVLNLNSGDADINFSGNKANGLSNDIHNAGGTVNFLGDANNVNLTGGISGNGTVNKTNSGTLTIGDSATYTGVFNQNGGATIFNGTLFNGQNNINAGNLELAQGSIIGANSSINLALGSSLLLTTSDSLTFSNNSLSGAGTITKNGSGNLIINGDNSQYSGIFTQNAGSTIFSGNLFNNNLNISNSEIELATGSNFSTNSIINLGSSGTLNISKNDNLTLTAGKILGSGSVNKTGSGELILSGNNSSYSGNFTQSAGATTVSETSTLFGGTNTINGGSLNVYSDTINYDVTLGGDSTTSGTLNNLAMTNNEIIVSNSDILFSGQGAVANFAKNENLVGNANYLLSTQMGNSNSNTIKFTDSNVKLGTSTFDGTTIYSFENSVLDLTSNSLTNTTFNNLIANNSSLNFDISFTSSTEIASDTLSVNSASPQIIALNAIKVLNDKDSGLVRPEPITVLGGNIQFKNGSSAELATALFNYTVEAQGQDIILTQTTPQSTDTLNYVNMLVDNRGFNISNAAPIEYNISASLDNMGTGNFVVQGYNSNPQISILSGVLLATISEDDENQIQGSFFKVVNDNTEFVINDITVLNAKKDGEGSVLLVDNANSSALMSNVIVQNNISTGTGGAVSQNLGNLAVTNSTFTSNTSNSNGGALSAVSASISSSDFTTNTADGNGGALNVKTGGLVEISGSSTFQGNTALGYGGAVYNSGNLILNSISGDIEFTGNADQTGVNDIYNNDGNIYISGTSGNVSINSGLSGTGTLNMTNTSNLYLNGINRDYVGKFLQTNGNTYVNNNSIFFGGTSIITGGSLNWLPVATLAKPANGVLQIQGGNLNLGSQNVNAILTLNNTSDLISPAANIYIYNGSTLNNYGTVTLNSGDAWFGNINNSGNLILDGFSHSTAPLQSIYTQENPNSNLILQNNSSFLFSGGTESNPVAINEGNILIGNGTTGSTVYVYENNSITGGANVQLGKNNFIEIGNIYIDDSTPYKGGSVTFSSGDTLDGKVQLNEGDLVFEGFNFNENSGQLVENGGTFTINNGSNVTFGSNVIINKGQPATTDPVVAPAIPSEIIVSSNSNLNLNTSSPTINADYVTLNSTGKLNVSSGLSLNLPNTLTVNGGELNTLNGEIANATVNNLVIGDNGANFSLDLSPTGTSDTFNFNNITTSASTGEINISNFGFTQVPFSDEIYYQIFNTSGQFPSNVKFNDSVSTVTPIKNYELISQGNGAYYARATGFNPQVYRGQVATMSMYNHQLAVNSMLFNHVYLVSEENLAQKNPNRYAAIIPQFAPYQYNREDGSLWFKSYVNFETLAMTQDLNVRNNFYGALIGADFPVVKLKEGWEFLPTAYVGYNGGTQSFEGVNNYQNGGQIGFMGTFMKNDFISSILMYAGGYGNDMQFGGIKDITGNWFAGSAIKTAYNFHPTKNLIIQPTALVSYNIFGQQNWDSSFGALSMNSGLLNGINVGPGLNIIYGRGTWSIYGTLQYLFYINDNISGSAAVVNLPSLKMRHGYLEYGVGVVKSSKNKRLSGYGQITIRNGGRTGVGFQVGLTYKL